MKRILLASLLPISVMASGVSVGVGAGYGLPFPGSRMGTDRTSTTGSTTTKQLNDSYAAGFHAGVDARYGVNDVIAIGLGAVYQMSGDRDVAKTSSTTVTSTSTSKSVLNITQFAVQPQVVFSSKGETITPYARVQMHIGFPSMTSKYDYSYTSSSTGASTSSQTTELTGGIAFGYGAGLGVEYAITPAMAIFGEVVGESWNWSPEKAKVTKATEDGQSVLDQMTPDELTTTYVDSYTYDPAVGPVGKSLKMYETFAATSVNLGVRFQF